MRAQNNPKIREQLVLILTWWFVIGILIKTDFSDFVGVRVGWGVRQILNLETPSARPSLSQTQSQYFAISLRSDGLWSKVWAQIGVESRAKSSYDVLKRIPA